MVEFPDFMFTSDPQPIKEFTSLNIYLFASASALVIETMEALTAALRL